MSCYVHHVPGRLRVRLPAVKGNAVKAGKLVERLNALEGTTSAVANPVTGSILILYDPRITSARACLVVLNVDLHPVPLRQTQFTSKVAEAAAWYVLEKTFERCFPLMLTALF